MKAVILAAGINSRLKEVINNIPKCLLKVGDTTIIDHQIKLITSIGRSRFEDVYVIGGYKIEKLNYMKELGVNLIFNPMFKEFNNIYSFYLAKNMIDEDFILFNGDVLVDQRIFKFLIESNYRTAFVIDNINKIGKEEMKVIVTKNKIKKFGKDIDPNIAYGEYIGLAKISLEDAKMIFNCMEKLLKEGYTDIWYEIGINYVLNKIDAFTVHTDGLSWIEVDTPEDYIKAKEMQNKITHFIEY